MTPRRSISLAVTGLATLVAWVILGMLRTGSCCPSLFRMYALAPGVSAGVVGVSAAALGWFPWPSTEKDRGPLNSLVWWLLVLSAVLVTLSRSLSFDIGSGTERVDLASALVDRFAFVEAVALLAPWLASASKRLRRH